MDCEVCHGKLPMILRDQPGHPFCLRKRDADREKRAPQKTEFDMALERWREPQPEPEPA